jgi:hypothetical protein
MDFHPCVYIYTRCSLTKKKIIKETHRKRDSENGMKEQTFEQLFQEENALALSN